MYVPNVWGREAFPIYLDCVYTLGEKEKGQHEKSGEKRGINMEQKSSNEVENLAYYIDNKALVTVTEMGHLMEVQYMEKQNASCGIKVLPGNRYVNLSTGEVKEFKKSEIKDNYKSLKKTFKRLRYLINNNFTGNGNEKFITLTYGEDIDEKRLYTDFKNFMKRLRYQLKKDPKKFGTSIEYISVVEPNGQGRWHCHVLMKFVGVKRAGYLPQPYLQELWGQGIVDIRDLKDNDNIGAYLTAYLTDVELTEETAGRAMAEGSEIVTKDVKGVEKRFVKGGRLHYYPSGMNLYRKSKGIKMPERKTVRMENLHKKIAGRAPSYQRKIDLDKEDFKNTLVFLEYNNKRGR